MKQAQVTVRKIDALVAFLPAFEAPGREFIQKWVTPGGDESVPVMPYPEYDEDVKRFFELASQEIWLDHDYDPETAGRMLTDPVTIAAADLPEVKTMLTHCVQGERFCNGHWSGVLKDGSVVSLLKRLRELREQMQTQAPQPCAS
jgi:hypothetical protein